MNAQTPISATTTTVAGYELRRIIDRLERMAEEQKGLADDVKDILSEAKSKGYDTKIIRKVLAIRKRKKEDVEAENMVLETYCSALGMQLSFL